MIQDVYSGSWSQIWIFSSRIRGAKKAPAPGSATLAWCSAGTAIVGLQIIKIWWIGCVVQQCLCDCSGCSHYTQCSSQYAPYLIRITTDDHCVSLFNTLWQAAWRMWVRCGLVRWGMQHVRPLPGLRKRGLQPAMGVHVPGKKKFSVADPHWIRIRIQHFLSMRIRIQVQGCDDQKLEKNLQKLQLIKNCNLHIPRPP